APTPPPQAGVLHACVMLTVVGRHRISVEKRTRTTTPGACSLRHTTVLLKIAISRVPKASTVVDMLAAQGRGTQFLLSEIDRASSAAFDSAPAPNTT
ncbi:hypothetical protein NHX12_033524, partial [Muraenolepis orangiensis]